MSESRKALHALIDLLREVDQRFLGPEWNLNGDADVAEGARAVMHMLQGGLASHFEDDPDHPLFRRIVSPTRKMTGDNPDAIYYDTAVSARHTYRVRGNLAGAVYTSLTIEADAAEGRFASGTAGVINDGQFDVASDGSFEVFLGGPKRPRNWIALPENASRITTRHYFEEETSAAANPIPATQARCDRRTRVSMVTASGRAILCEQVEGVVEKVSHSGRLFIENGPFVGGKSLVFEVGGFVVAQVRVSDDEPGNAKCFKRRL